MKKKLFIIIPVVLILILGVYGYFYFSNRTASIITLDINPSIEIHLKSNKEVKEIIPLNDDAKKVVSDNMVGTNIYKTISLITRKVIDEGFAPDGELSIIFYSEGNEVSDLEKTIKDDFKKEGREVTLIKVDNVSDKDKELAKKYNISPAKVSYLSELTEENENVTVETLIEKPVQEIEEFKDRGVYCDEGYTLEGDRCVKEIRREGLKEGKICPQDYFEYDGKCYEQVEGTTTDKLVCFKDETLENGKCYSRETVNAIAAKMECTKGEEKTKGELGIQNREGTDKDEKVCVDLSKATHPVSPCELNDGTEWKKANGKCYWHRAGLLPSGCPGKIRVGSECWDDASNVLICKGARDGKQYKSRNDYCEKSIKIIEPTVTEYRCEDDFILEGDKCKRETVHDTHLEKICPSGYTLLDSGQCINKKKTVDKVDGSYCEHPNAKREGNECIIFDIKEANK